MELHPNESVAISESAGLSYAQRTLLAKLAEGPKGIRELQEGTPYNSRSGFMRAVVKPLLEQGIIEREGGEKSKTAVYFLRK